MTLERLAGPRELHFTHGLDYGMFGGGNTPEVEVEVAALTDEGALRGRPVRTSVMVDSGADYTLLDDRWMRSLGLDESEGFPAEMTGMGGGTIGGRLIDVSMRLSGSSMIVPVIFCGSPRPQLLGRAGAFEALRIAFLHGERRLLTAVA